LGVSRCLAAIVEAHHDEDGIRFPITVAPFEVILILVNPEDAEQRAAAERLYEELNTLGVEVLYDDRDERSGVKFKDADLIGVPLQVVVGRAVKDGQVELRLRTDKNAERLPLESAAQAIAERVQQMKSVVSEPAL
ncbi:MAG: His/Gly/Thr/Pro-type tRNA ligase C-terminal domain-containing protein, partial [Fimbriimonadales bacterium]|nr:His/Gly/Thr/Pro-type tRNA ligase C-terminal domain-containing protein [Fimbriimonadales bacterium]